MKWVDETPGLDQDVIARDQGLVRCQKPLCGTVESVAAIGGGIPGRAVDEDAQGVSAGRRFPAPVASPIMRALSDAISVPRDVPRSKTMERSAPRGRSAKSWSTRRRMYSASEMPSAAARARTCACRSRIERYLGAYHHYGAIIMSLGRRDKEGSPRRHALCPPAVRGDWLCVAGGFGVQSAATMERGDSDV